MEINLVLILLSFILQCIECEHIVDWPVGVEPID